MSNYNGTKCISCGETFKDNDDVVVCPECGTPYHRECYLKEGKCINTTLHESGESWKPEYESNSNDDSVSTEPIRCIRCGAQNPPEGIFCNKCGMPLSGNGDSARPFNSARGNSNSNMNGFYGNQQRGFNGQQQGGFPFGGQMVFDNNSDIDGIKLEDYAQYTGKNSFGLLSNFIRFGNFGGKIAINIGALVFPEFYFFYRKMYKHGILFMLLIFLLSIPGMIALAQTGIMDTAFLNTNIDVNSSNFNMIYSLCSYLMMGVRFLCGFYGTYWYYKNAKKDISKIRNENQTSDEEVIKRKIAAKGGTSWPSVIIAGTGYCVIVLVLCYLINTLFL